MGEIKTIYINPLTDFGFKLLFGREENKKYLISFLNALLKENIVDVTYHDKEGGGDNREDRSLIYDIYCETSDGRKFIVEMQNKYQDFFDDRAIYYISHEFVRQARKGDDWKYQLLPVVGVFMMNFDWRDYREKGPLSGKNDFLCEHVGLWNYTAKTSFSDKINMYFIKLPLMEKTPEECENDFDIWIYLLKNLENMDAIPAAFSQNKIFMELGQKARVAALSSSDRTAYEKSLKVYRDNYAIAQTERRLGKEEGRAEGLAEGLAKGKAEGRAEGRTEGHNEVALNMLKMNLDCDLISKLTGLSTEQIKELSEK